MAEQPFSGPFTKCELGDHLRLQPGPFI
jgi:hypothetical protein